MRKTTGYCIATMLVATILTPTCTPCSAETPSETPELCDVTIDGQLIEKLVLRTADSLNRYYALSESDFFTFIEPGETIQLPSGDYVVTEVLLLGSYYHRGTYDEDNSSVLHVTPEGPNRLTVGAPLSASATVERHGKILDMTYRRSDRGGREYFADYSLHISSPSSYWTNYTILADGREIASGSPRTYPLSYQVPWTTGSANLEITLSSDFGEFGDGTAPTIEYPWRWYYCVPTLPLWIILVLVLTVPKSNRRLRHWLVMPLGPVALAILGRTLEQDSSFRRGIYPDFDAQLLLLTTLAIAWVTVWALADWNQRGSLNRRFFISLVIMMSIGAVGYVSYNGFHFSRDWLELPLGWLLLCITLLLGMRLTHNNGQTRSLKQGALRSLLWLPVISGITLLLISAIAAIYFDATLSYKLSRNVVVGIFDCGLALSDWITASIIAITYSLPVCILTIVSNDWKERMTKLFGPEPNASTNNKPTETPDVPTT